jgi:hypothetical protein
MRPGLRDVRWGLRVIPARRIDRRIRVLGNPVIFEAFEDREQDG